MGAKRNTFKPTITFMLALLWTGITSAADFGEPLICLNAGGGAYTSSQGFQFIYSTCTGDNSVPLLCKSDNNILSYAT